MTEKKNDTSLCRFGVTFSHLTTENIKLIRCTCSMPETRKDSDFVNLSYSYHAIQVGIINL